MKIHLLLGFAFAIFSSSCCRTQQGSVEEWKQEIIDTEAEFAEMAINEGVQKAFVTYAANDVALLRNKQLIIGKDSLFASFEKGNTSFSKESLTWKPDFVDVSSSGDLGYTYGKYVYTLTDSVGVVTVSEGIFHTVWKRQANGAWRFVWD